jgi:hypothetical protein
MTTTTLTLTVPGARLHYDVRGTAPPVAAPADVLSIHVAPLIVGGGIPTLPTRRDGAPRTSQIRDNSVRATPTYRVRTDH